MKARYTFHFCYQVMSSLMGSTQTKLFVTSEVPVFQVFSDDPTEQAHHISDHMRSVMDDLVSEISNHSRDMFLHRLRRACPMT